MARRRPRESWWLAIPALLFLIAPFFALVFATRWTRFSLDAGDWSAIGVSLGYGACAMLLVVALGTPFAWWLARTHFPARWIADAIVLLPLLSPPLALGIVLETLYGPYGAAGAPLARLGLLLTNSAPAFVLALTYGALPFFIVLARAAFEGVSPEYEALARTLGKSQPAIFFTVTLPLARVGLGAALAIAWVRALGEFGICLIVAYFPMGIPVRLWVNLQDVGLGAVFPLLWIFYLVALPLPLWLGLRAQRRSVA